jgi:hypothetical protein
MEFAKDPLVNAVYQGIQVTYDNECYGSCLILIYCGVDTMSYLDMPPSQAEVHAKDFIRWADRYLSPNLRNRATQITGEELYSARCAVVHTYTVESKRTKIGSTRTIAYMIGGAQSVVWNSKVDPKLVLLRLEILQNAFFTAIDKFLTEGYAAKHKRPILEARLNKLLNTIPYTKGA